MTISYRKRIARVVVLYLIASMATVSVALAQTQPTGTDKPATAPEGRAASPRPAEPGDAQPAGEPAQPEGVPTPAAKPVSADNDDLRGELEQQREEIAELKQEVESLKTMVDSSGDEDYDAAIGDQAFEPTFRVSGFFDLNLYYYEVDERDSGYGVTPDNVSLVVNRFNLYFASQMSETFSALAEIRFTAMPLGCENDYEDTLFFNTPYDRVDTTVFDPYSTEEVRLGSIVIERVHLTWKPLDAFGVIAGRFLTPYGIWNVDHGSPARVSVQTPYFMVRQFIPSAQTGVQLFGRVFPFSNTYVDYALTLSNNRGPADEVYDLENNKALGARLKGSYEEMDFTVALGGYLYYGTFRDVHKRVGSYGPVYRIEVEETKRYSELVGSLDFLLKLYDARLQIEYIQGAIEYSTRALRLIGPLKWETPLNEYQPDYEEWSLYALLSYDFFFELGATEMMLSPYVGFEYIVPDDTMSDYDEYNIRGGLAFRPLPFAVLKLESYRAFFPHSDMMKHGMWSYAAQMAVSF